MVARCAEGAEHEAQARPRCCAGLAAVGLDGRPLSTGLAARGGAWAVALAAALGLSRVPLSAGCEDVS